MSDLGSPDRPDHRPEDRPRGAVSQLGRDVFGDLGDELKFALVTFVFVAVGAGIGYAVRQGEGAIVGGIAGAAVLGVIGAIVLLRWVWDLVTGARRRMRSR